MITMRVEAEFPDNMIKKEGVNLRYTFRRTMENRVRRRMNNIAQHAGVVTRFYSLADDFEVHAQTTEEAVTFQMVNTAKEASLLLQPEGIPEHTIEQEPHMVPRGKLLAWAAMVVRDEDPEYLSGVAQAAIKRRGVIIDHPGIPADKDLWNHIRVSSAEISEVIRQATRDWQVRFGQEVVE